MVHLIYRLYLKAVFFGHKLQWRYRFFLENGCFSHKACFKLQKISVRSQNWCLTIPKLVPYDPKIGAWRSQKWCLTIVRHHFFWDPKYDAWQLAVQMSTDHLVATQESDPSSSVQFQHAVAVAAGSCPTKAHRRPPLIVRHHIWDPRNGAWRLSGVNFGTVRHQFWDRQAPVLGLSGTSFGIFRHQFWDLTLIFRVQKGAKTV